MGFDDEVDEARARLHAALAEEEPAFDETAALEAMLARLSARIQSRRLGFGLEYIFESGHDDYFDDFIDDDPDSFVERLYETLRADLPKYEVENDVG